MALKKNATAGGHSKKAPGASCYLNEYTEDRKCNKAFVSALKARGVAAKDCSNEYAPASKELARECSLANAYGGDLFVAWHFNAASKTSGKRGVEVWYYTGSKVGKSYAEKTSKKLANLMGLPNRGAKATTGLYVLRHTKAPAILIEVCFVDAKGDTDAYKKLGYQGVAAAVADVIAGTNEGETADTKPPASSGSPKPSSGSDVAVDGWIDVNTNKKAQRYFGLKCVDGVMSNQDASLKRHFPRIDSRAINYSGGNGSNLVAAMQRLFGVKDDGLLGPKTIKAMQRYLGATADGILGQNTAKAWQKWLNKH